MFYKMGKRYYGCSIVFLIFIQSLCSQTGGRQIFQFLNLSSGARIAALGGMPIAWRANDPGIAFYNPSTLTKEMSGKIYFAHQFYFADISNGHAAYSYHAAKPDLNFQLGVHYLSLIHILEKLLAPYKLKPKEASLPIVTCGTIRILPAPSNN